MLSVIRWSSALAAIAFLFTSSGAIANGGTVRVASQTAGPFVVSVFTNPNPLTVGTADISVLVQRPGTSEVVQDVRITVQVRSDSDGTEREYPATREAATNKLYYAANVNLERPGKHTVTVRLRGPNGEVGEVGFDADVSEPGLLDQPLLIAAAVLIPLVGAGWWLSQGRAGAKRNGRMWLE